MTINEETLLESLKDYLNAGFSPEEAVFLIAEAIAEEDGEESVEELAEELYVYLKEELGLKSKTEKLAETISRLDQSQSHLAMNQTSDKSLDEELLSLMREGKYPWGKVSDTVAKSAIHRMKELDEETRLFVIEEIWNDFESFSSFVSGGVEALVEGMEKNNAREIDVDPFEARRQLKNFGVGKKDQVRTKTPARIAALLDQLHAKNPGLAKKMNMKPITRRDYDRAARKN